MKNRVFLATAGVMLFSVVFIGYKFYENSLPALTDLQKKNLVALTKVKPSGDPQPIKVDDVNWYYNLEGDLHCYCLGSGRTSCPAAYLDV